MKFQLKRLPAFDLTRKYALRLEDGDIVHFQVVGLKIILEQQEVYEAKVIEAVREYLSMPEAEIGILPEDSLTVHETVKELTADAFLASLDGKALNGLLTQGIHSTLHQFNYNIPWSGLFPFTLFAGIVEKIASFIYQKIHDNFYQEQTHSAGFMDVPFKSKYHERVANLITPTLGFFNTLTHDTYVRRVVPVSLLAVVFGEDQIDQAIQELADDLNLISKKFKILGHLADGTNSPIILVPMPNSVGNDKKIYAIGCFPIVDFIKKFNKKHLPTNAIDKYYRDLGVKHTVPEGGISLLNDATPYSDLVIDTIKVGSLPVQPDMTLQMVSKKDSDGT